MTSMHEPPPEPSGCAAPRRSDGPIRVLHVCDKFGIKGATVHGVTRLLSWWFPRWDAERFDCRLLGLRGHDASAEFLIENGIDAQTLGKGRFDPSTLGALTRIIRHERIDLVHLHGYGASNFGRLAARRTGIAAIVHEHAVFPKVPLYQQVADRALAGSTAVGIAVSRSVLDFMAERRHLPRERLRIVPNGAPCSDFRPVDDETAAAIRARWKLPTDRPVIGVIGRLNEQKGVVFLIRALEALARRGIRPTLVVVGDGDQQGALRAEAAALGIEEQVVFTGFASDTRALQTLFDIQAFPSLFEGTPLTLFEAMAMARPIVSTDVDGLGEVLRHEETALLVPPRDPAALAQGLARLLAEPALAARLAANARGASDAYDIQCGVEALQDIYVEVLGKARTVPPAGPRPQ